MIDISKIYGYGIWDYPNIYDYPRDAIGTKLFFLVNALVCLEQVLEDMEDLSILSSESLMRYWVYLALSE